MLNLQIVGDRNELRLSARLLGQKPKESIFIDIPATASVPFELRLHDELNARGLAGRFIVGFKCSVIRVCTSPYRYFHLSYPEAIECSEIRQSERVKVDIPAQAQTAASNASPVQIRDLSASGALLIGPDLGKVGDQIQLSFELSFGKVARSLSLTAVIRNLVLLSDQDASLVRIGVQFEEVSEADALLLTNFIYEKLLLEAGAFA